MKNYFWIGFLLSFFNQPYAISDVQFSPDWRLNVEKKAMLKPLVPKEWEGTWKLIVDLPSKKIERVIDLSSGCNYFFAAYSPDERGVRKFTNPLNFFEDRGTAGLSVSYPPLFLNNMSLDLILYSEGPDKFVGQAADYDADVWEYTATMTRIDHDSELIPSPVKVNYSISPSRIRYDREFYTAASDDIGVYFKFGDPLVAECLCVEGSSYQTLMSLPNVEIRLKAPSGNGLHPNMSEPFEVRRNNGEAFLSIQGTDIIDDQKIRGTMTLIRK